LRDASGDPKAIVDAIAGEFMGKGKRRGRVFTWIPTHLADAQGETSPRTFLTAWREAALHESPSSSPVDHLGIMEGVRKASADRLAELNEDYPWIPTVLEPLRGQMVPMEQATLEELWQRNGTAEKILDAAKRHVWLAPVQFEDDRKSSKDALLDALATIGVIEIRSNGKINVPDIFRVEAGIKRKGGVKPPTRGGPSER